MNNIISYRILFILTMLIVGTFMTSAHTLAKQFTLTIKVTGNRGATFDDSWMGGNVVSFNDEYSDISGTEQFTVSEGDSPTLYIYGDNVIKLLVNGVDMTSKYRLNAHGLGDTIEVGDKEEILMDAAEIRNEWHHVNLGNITKNTTVEVVFPDDKTTVNGINYLLCGNEAYVTYSRELYGNYWYSNRGTMEHTGPLGAIPQGMYEGWGNHYSGAIQIPDNIIYNGKNYTVTEIMEQAFLGWHFNYDGIETITVEDENGGYYNKPTGQYSYTSYGEVEYIILPKTLKRIRTEAFVNCPNLEYVEFPGESLQEIGDGAFSGCPNINYLRMRTKTPAILGTDAFTHQKNTTLLVPTKCKNAYTAAAGWKDFKSVAESDRTRKLTIKASGGGTVGWYNDDVRLGSKTFTIWSGMYGLLYFKPDVNHTTEEVIINGNKIDNYSNPYPLEYLIKDTTMVEVTFSNKSKFMVTAESVGEGTLYIGTEDPYGEAPAFSPRRVKRADSGAFEVGPNSKGYGEFEEGEVIWVSMDGYENWETSPRYWCSPVKVILDRKDITNDIMFDDWANQFGGTANNNHSLPDLQQCFPFTLTHDTDLSVLFVKWQEAITHDGITYGIIDENNRQNVRMLFGDCEGTVSIPESFYEDGYHEVVEVGDHAFSLCPDLLAVSLPSSVQTIGKGLFSGSENICALEVQGNVNINDNILEGMDNPNFLLYVPAKSYNKTSIQNVVDNNRAEKIILTDAEGGNNFYCPKSFTAKEISYTHRYQMESGIDKNSMGWETIALPFDVKSIKHSTKGDLTPFANYSKNLNKKPFWLFEYSSKNTNGWNKVGEIKANTPYIISMPNNDAYDNEYNLGGEVTFSAKDATVKSSADLIQAAYNNRTFIPTFQWKAKNGINALNVYNQYVEVFNKDNTDYEQGSAFVHELRNVHPFEAYIINSNGTNADFIIFDDMPTGLPLLPTLPDVSNYQPGTYRVVNLSGQVVREVNVVSSSEAVTGLPAGIYIVNGRKVVVK